MTLPLSRYIERFWARVDKGPPGGCWLWTGALDRDGYGNTSITFGHGMARGAHRVALTLTQGAIPPGMSVLHRCDVRNCCSPRHLYTGTQADNVADRDRRGRGVWLRGVEHPRSKLTESQVLAIRGEVEREGITMALAREYGVHHATISAIRTGRYWSHLGAS